MLYVLQQPEQPIEITQPMSSNQSENWIGRNDQQSNAHHYHNNNNNYNNNINNHHQHHNHLQHHQQLQQLRQQQQQQQQQQRHYRAQQIQDNEDTNTQQTETTTTTISRHPIGNVQPASMTAPDHWKPSVYAVMVILFSGAVVLACMASFLYAEIEKVCKHMYQYIHNIYIYIFTCSYKLGYFKKFQV